MIWAKGIPLGWLPVGLGCVADNSLVRWMKVGSASFSEPFFYQSVDVLRNADPPAIEVETELDVLLAARYQFASVAPAGIIFHMSRCGSTLLLNAMKTIEGVAGYSEPSLITRTMVLSSGAAGYWRALSRPMLEAVITLFSNYRGAPPQRVVLKCNLPDIVGLPWIRSIWPDVPCVILTRNPLEVMVSNLQKPAPWLLDREALQSSLFGRVPEEASGLVDYCAWMLGRYCQVAAAVADSRCIVVDYENLDASAIRGIAQQFGLEVSGHNEAFQASLRMSAKSPGRVFEDDRRRKQEGATSAIRQSAERWAEGPYKELVGVKGFRHYPHAMEAVAGIQGRP
jgi:hypothetical protein